MAEKTTVIIESGATKSEWRVLDKEGRQINQCFLPGMNVSAMSLEEVQRILSEGFASLGLGELSGFYLYTAGVLSPDIAAALEGQIRSLCRVDEIDIQNDLMGAARAVCGHEAGIAAILGTGANCCFYDGKTLSRKVYSGGYILGDEGSAATLGKRFLADYLKGLVPKSLSDDFAREFGASYEGIVQRVYHSPAPSAFLGSLAPLILRHFDEPYAKALVEGNFRDFIERFLLRYDTAAYPVGITGGFGWACRDMLRPLCEKAGIRISRFVQAPIEGLCRYHLE
ncbi:MAG: hypothetical protein J6Y32_07075 [Bacteroidales bacterium]|nr:hypothetical protein [Bacteroidales bacterium]